MDSDSSSPLASYPDEQPPPPIARLCPEIMTRIFEQLQDISPRSVATARGVCRSFYHLATPVLYAEVELNHKLVHQSAATRFPHVLCHIYAHTRHVVIRRVLDRDGVNSFLDKLQKLRSVRYSFPPLMYPILIPRPGGDTSSYCSYWVPADIRHLEPRDRAGVKVHIEGLPPDSLSGKYGPVSRDLIPAWLLASLDASVAFNYPVPQNSWLKDLLLDSPFLEAFRYRGGGQQTHFSFREEDGRLAALEELSLRSYEWIHGPEEVSRHWDFSRLHSLRLVAVSIYRFLLSVSFARLVNLQVLRLDDAGIDRQLDEEGSLGAHGSNRATTASRMVRDLVQNYIKAIRTLELITNLSIFRIDAVLRHAATLQHLVLRDSLDFSENFARSPALSLVDLRRLSHSLTNLRSLEIDIDMLREDRHQFLLEIFRFPQLRKLTLDFESVEVGQPSITRKSPYSDDEWANWMFGILLNQKTGPVKWESVVIRVGRWQNLMGGGFGHGWRARYQRRMYTKWTFVPKQAAPDPGGGGGGDDTGGGAASSGPPKGEFEDFGEYKFAGDRSILTRVVEGHPWPD